MTNAAQKTPISLLQELCAQQGMTPDYKLMSVEGAVHAPTFMYRVQVNEIVATATGQSKKKAKHAAAKAVLERLLAKDGEFNQGFQSDGVTVNAENLNEIIANFCSEPAPVPQIEENAEDNPVGKLQEHCMKNRWQPPYYETENATGLPHEKIFTIVCFVGEFTTTGEGKSKRLAKRQAAAKMLERLNSMKDVSKHEEEIAKENMNEDEAVGKISSVVDDKDETDSSVIDHKDETESSVVDDKDETDSSVIDHKDETESSIVDDKDETDSSVIDHKDETESSNVDIKDETDSSHVDCKVESDSSHVDCKDESDSCAVDCKDEGDSCVVDHKEEAGSSIDNKIDDLLDQKVTWKLCEVGTLATQDCEGPEDDKC